MANIIDGSDVVESVGRQGSVLGQALQSVHCFVFLLHTRSRS